MKGADLNLLVIFDAIMTEGSIGGAAERLAMTQPAVSNAVARMRQVFNDPLFVKNGRGIKPTAQATNLWNQISHPLVAINNAVNPQQFDPATAKRTFRIAAADIVVEMVWPPLRRLIEKEAPLIDIHAVPYSKQWADSLLANAEADLAVGLAEDMNPADRTAHLFVGDFICAMSINNPLAKEELTLDRFVQADHLLVSLSGDAHGITDDVLETMGLSRRVAMTVNNFGSVPALLKETNLICVVSSTVVARLVNSGELFVTKCPVAIPKVDISIAWHARHDRDPGLHWLREKVMQFTVEEWARYRPACCYISEQCSTISEQCSKSA